LKIGHIFTIPPETPGIYRSLFEKPQGKRPLGRIRLRLERKLKMIKMGAKFVCFGSACGESRDVDPPIFNLGSKWT